MGSANYIISLYLPVSLNLEGSIIEIFVELLGIYIESKCWVSSNINEVIRSVLNFLIFFTKRFHKYKKEQNSLQRTKIKNVYKKHLSSNINEVIKTI